MGRREVYRLEGVIVESLCGNILREGEVGGGVCWICLKDRVEERLILILLFRFLRF